MLGGSGWAGKFLLQDAHDEQRGGDGTAATARSPFAGRGALFVLRWSKWCKRSNKTDNPLLHERDVHPFLRWRRLAGAECASCPWVISGDQELKSQDREELLLSINSDPEFTAPQCAATATGEAQRRGQAAASQRCWQRARLGQQPHPPGPVSPSAAATVSSADAAASQDLARRLQKRLSAVVAIKRTPEYSDAYVYDGGSLPTTPDPTDLTISKRSWERSVQDWRRLLRRLAALH